VGIFGVGVLEHARRRGVGGALTTWLLERTFAGGATFAHLNPDTDAAARLYARLGFIETIGLDVYCDI
jgi:ribosomal protein S18 acetylase RimI-like enzyme